MAKSAKTSNILDAATASRMAGDEALTANSLVGTPTVPFSDVTDLVEQLQSASQSIVFRSFAHSALFQAISICGELFIARSQPAERFDEVNVERLEQRFNLQAGVYNYFKTEAETYAETKYDQAMSFQDMFDYVLKLAPKDPTLHAEDYSEEFLAKLGIPSREAAIQADAEQYAKDLALHTAKVDSLTANKDAVYQAITQAGDCTPDLSVDQYVRMLQKAELKLSDEPLRLWSKRSKIPGALSKMTCIAGDLPIMAKAIKRLRDQYKGDSRVRAFD